MNQQSFNRAVGLMQYGVFIHCLQQSFIHQDFAVDNRRLHIRPGGGIDDAGDRVDIIRREGVEVVEV
ncbi:hypothetical protein D3C74_444480 [compost metagenome]